MPEQVLALEGDFQEGVVVWWLARVVTPDNITITQSTVDLGYTLDIYDLSSRTPNTTLYTETGAASALVFNALQANDGWWGVDNPGYQFRHAILPASFTHTGGHTYLFEYKLNSTQWGVIPVHAFGTCIASRKT